MNMLSRITFQFLLMCTAFSVYAMQQSVPMTESDLISLGNKKYWYTVDDAHMLLMPKVDPQNNRLILSVASSNDFTKKQYTVDLNQFRLRYNDILVQQAISDDGKSFVYAIHSTNKNRQHIAIGFQSLDNNLPPTYTERECAGTMVPLFYDKQWHLILYSDTSRTNVTRWDPIHQPSDLIDISSQASPSIASNTPQGQKSSLALEAKKVEFLTTFRRKNNIINPKISLDVHVQEASMEQKDIEEINKGFVCSWSKDTNKVLYISENILLNRSEDHGQWIVHLCDLERLTKKIYIMDRKSIRHLRCALNADASQCLFSYFNLEIKADVIHVRNVHDAIAQELTIFSSQDTIGLRFYFDENNLFFINEDRNLAFKYDFNTNAMSKETNDEVVKRVITHSRIRPSINLTMPNNCFACLRQETIPNAVCVAHKKPGSPLEQPNAETDQSIPEQTDSGDNTPAWHQTKIGKTALLSLGMVTIVGLAATVCTYIYKKYKAKKRVNKKIKLSKKVMHNEYYD